ncbi:MAG: Asp-tRNA(Asn)/Glu-tRNA(Gln) amidotransferase subunit GatA [Calditrichaeota bacterium]|nr:Asp-tRNA(Asn)/Glu-tRNA(Gln) amidotransferase subunit GatA [Calditrichota bacterium]
MSLSFSERKAALKSGRLDIKSLVDVALEHTRRNAHLNAFITLMSELAYEQAGRVATRLLNGEYPPLAGVILAVKDNIALRGVRLTCASKILENYISPYTATALQRLIDAGAVVIGKTNLDEFAMGSSTEHSAYGVTLNPHNLERVPGGSSGGSAAAVAAGVVTSALGSETGGSVRQPAAFCGILGLKPTYGRVSRYGLTAFGSSLDQIGVMSSDVEEAAHIFQAMAGCDANDNTTSPTPVPDCSALSEFALEGLRIGLPVEYFGEGIQPAVRNTIEKAAAVLRRSGAVVSECSLPHTKYAIPTYYIIAPAEASSNLARYDGVRYGPRFEGENGEDIIRASRQAGFGAEVKRRIMLGAYVLSAGYYDAYYKKAQRVRRLIRQDFSEAFRNYDLLMTPTAPTTAFKIGEKIASPLAMYLSDIFTASANLAGVPAISLPIGSDDKGLPIGMQLIAQDFREDLLFRTTKRIIELINI